MNVYLFFTKHDWWSYDGEPTYNYGIYKCFWFGVFGVSWCKCHDVGYTAPTKIVSGTGAEKTILKWNFLKKIE